MRNYKWLPVIMMTCVLALLFGDAPLAEEKKGEPPAPKVLVPAPFYKFESVLEGKEVLHDFIVQNKGEAELEILKVVPG